MKVRYWGWVYIGDDSAVLPPIKLNMFIKLKSSGEGKLLRANHVKIFFSQ